MLWDTGTFDQQPIPSSISIMLATEQRAQFSTGKKKTLQTAEANKFMINKAPAPVLAVFSLLDGDPPLLPSSPKKKRE